MTKRQRAQVVELLRCAADGLLPTSTGAWTDALDGLDTDFEIEMLATRAFSKASDESGLPYGLDRVLVGEDCEIGRGLYLEAALRVELGEWP